MVTPANGQPAIGFYAWDEAEQAYRPFALDVLTLRGDKVSDVIAFVVRAIDGDRAQERYHRWVERAGSDTGRVYGTFARFRLPDQLD